MKDKQRWILKENYLRVDDSSNEIPNEELNKWCGTEGVNYYEGDTALGFLFKYVVPKLGRSVRIVFVLCEELKMLKGSHSYPIRCEIDQWNKDNADEIWTNISWAYGDNYEDALFWAIYSLIRCDSENLKP